MRTAGGRFESLAPERGRAIPVVIAGFGGQDGRNGTGNSAGQRRMVPGVWPKRRRNAVVKLLEWR